MAKHSNHLINETSPYLLQHAHNPVEWYPWGPEALQRAKEENKPILVSIGYAACHWCHVMERESFEDEETALLMNREFVNIKIDREERPDLDHIYMDAVQAMTGSGGWPLNAFLTPDGKPFYGGTYYPPRRAFNRASWTETLLGVAEAFKERRDEVNAQAENLMNHIVQSNSFGLKSHVETSSTFSFDNAGEMLTNILRSADTEWGGFGKAPKFPQTFTIQFLLRYYHVAGTSIAGSDASYIGKDNQKIALDQALLSLDKMIQGGIYDQVGGGFARYSTDTEWLAPHFEKMLYDNALLVTVLSEAYQLTKEPRYKEVIHETILFVQRELMSPDGGFYSALDADTEGEEGKFYVWSLNEIDEILGNQALVFCRYYDMTEKGNWEGKNIPRVRMSMEEFARKEGMEVGELLKLLQNGREKLLAVREKRVRPLLDDKILLGWNALMNSACSKAYMATGLEEYKELAVRNMKFLLSRFAGNKGQGYYHTWKKEGKYPAFLDDYAFLINALIDLQEITGDPGWLLKAGEMTELVESVFSEEETGFFYFTQEGQEDIILRKKEIYDGAIPSGNSMMAGNLYRLSILLDRPLWKERALKMVSSLEQIITKYPTSFGVWAALLMEIFAGTLEIAVVGKNNEELTRELHEFFLPYKVLMRSDTDNQQFPLLAGKTSSGKPLIYLCKDYACQQPVDSITRFMSLINRAKIGK
jgi:uncharacterized protein YyaL (SSP411 family)